MNTVNGNLPPMAGVAWSLALILVCAPGGGLAADFTGDVTDVRVVRRVDQHPGAALLWEPSSAVWRPKHLVVSFGAGLPGKTDMGDVLASVSTNDGDTWSDPLLAFDHNQRYGALQFDDSATKDTD